MLALTAATGRGATSIPVPGGFRSIALVAGGSAAVTPPRQPLHTGNTQPRNCSHQMSSFTPMGAQTRWSSSRAATSLRRQHDDYYKVLKLKQSATQKEVGCMLICLQMFYRFCFIDRTLIVDTR